MAALQGVASSIQSLESLCFCGICLEPFTRPVTLACGHTFCEVHLDSIQSCALCRAQTIPRRGHRKINTVLQSLLAKMHADIGANRIVDPSDVQISGIVQRGMSGAVYEGTYRGTRVAVKQLNIAAGTDAFTEGQLREINLVREIVHPCILKVIGTCPPPHAYIITPWCANGDLGAMIAANGGALQLSRTVKILRSVASAVTFLHSQNIVHRDLKPSNVMMLTDMGSILTAEHVCALSDFGVARPASDATMTGAIGTPAYTAPEVLNAESYGKPADVWGFGMIAYELVHGAAPYTGLRPMQVMMKVARGETPALDAALPRVVRQLLVKCARSEPSRRPTISWIVQEALPSLERECKPAPAKKKRKVHTAESLGDTLSLCVKDQTGEKTVFRLTYTTRMSKVFQAYAKRKGLAVGSLRFLLDGKALNEDMTPKSVRACTRERVRHRPHGAFRVYLPLASPPRTHAHTFATNTAKTRGSGQHRLPSRNERWLHRLPRSRRL